MRTPIQYLHKPYDLRSNVIFFHDGRYVREGSTRWGTDDGEQLDFHSYDGAMSPSLRWQGAHIPTGVRLRAMPGTKTEPFLHADRPWEDMLRHATVLRDDGVYRLWYGTRLHGCYAESDDGETWRKPELGICEVDGDRNNNIVMDSDHPPVRGFYSSGDVFIDPSAPGEERYKAFIRSRFDQQAFDEFMSKHPDSVEPKFQQENPSERGIIAMAGAASDDGLHWTAYPSPQVVHKSDTQNIAYYDTVLQKYVGYFRTHVFGRRAIGRAETEDFRRFPLPDTILWPDASLGLSEVWYASGRTCYPGAPDYHLMFCRKWRVADDRWYVHLATSPDGVLWGFPAQNQVLSPSEGRQWDSGAVTVGSGMVALPGNRVGVPIVGYEIPHKYPRFRGLGKFAWATWEKDRIVALEADEQGSFTTQPVTFQGSRLKLNVRTKHVGCIRVRVLDRDGQPLEGRTFEDCDYISGDHFDRVVTWRDDPDLRRHPGESVSFGIELSYGQLFSMRFE